ncbi:Retron-type reverse transcriptase [Kingella potus]|uniref:RNA-directed DNA polymerase n=1 Tax=Kingella potus TaxID=265175 RepID=A0A377R2E1_9NEIS|nr:retron Ec67 family RNA-directed DNA polymerase/endonuclease [Kingella potus]UOP00451.1 retron Ec67 family RNA-directed DNA polymerase/endonuclease [Kingella potus]STR02483.1 Retron-type reverse transcriptase [Kingella potus]
MFNHLIKLKLCNNGIDVVNNFHNYLGISVKDFWYIAYSLNHFSQFTSFTILKASGGERTILIPPQPLKDLQKKFATILNFCIREIQQENPNYLICNHAFEIKKSILTNAQIHRNKRYVLNIDLSDFFGSIHYGRISNFFKADKYFRLNDKVAKTLAQLACFRDENNKTFLPQGSPLSPIIASLIGNLLDIRLVKISKEYKLTYSRYADDLTFSSNKPIPEDLVRWNSENFIWEAGDRLRRVIEDSGFKINDKKTRLFSAKKRQTVTGITVNKTLNISEYYQKHNRAMLYSLFTSGKFLIGDKEGTINQLIGRLNYVASVKYLKQHHDMSIQEWEEERKKFAYLCAGNFDNKENSNRSIRLLRQAIFYKYFIGNNKPIIFPEGITDSIYFKLANKILNPNEHKENYIIQSINSELTKISLGGGTALINSFLLHAYKDYFINLKNLKIKSKHPVIFVLDYDQGLDVKDKNEKSKNNIPETHHMKDGQQWVHIRENIYLVLLRPLALENKKPTFRNALEMTCVENLLSHVSIGKIKVDDENHENIKFRNRSYPKTVFAKYVAKRSTHFDFSEFKKIFEIIDEIKKHFYQNSISI